MTIIAKVRRTKGFRRLFLDLQRRAGHGHEKNSRDLLDGEIFVFLFHQYKVLITEGIAQGQD